jgi:hypothetical protein
VGCYVRTIEYLYGYVRIMDYVYDYEEKCILLRMSIKVECCRENVVYIAP